MKILITGIAGAIGSHLAERFLSMGHEVVGIDALTPYYSPQIKKINISDVEAAGAKVYIKNLASDDISGIVEGVDFIFHLAAQPVISATTSFDDYLNNNIVATYNILEEAKKLSSLRGFVYASTSSVYGKNAQGDEDTAPKPTSHYGVTKLAGEQIALAYHRTHHMPVSALRFFSVYGERERPEKLYHKLIKAIYENKEFSLYEGAKNHVRSFTYVEDIIDGCVLVFEHFNKAVGEIFNLGNDTTVTTGEGIAMVEKIMNKSALLHILPKRLGDQQETSANIAKAKKVFGYNPKFSLYEGLEREVKWYGEKIHGNIQ